MSRICLLRLHKHPSRQMLRLTVMRVQLDVNIPRGFTTSFAHSRQGSHRTSGRSGLLRDQACRSPPARRHSLCQTGHRRRSGRPTRTATSYSSWATISPPDVSCVKVFGFVQVCDVRMTHALWDHSNMLVTAPLAVRN